MTQSIALLWAGLVLGVSFLATPVKFQAETLTLPVAVDVGRATFHALNRAEWLMLAATTVAIVVAARDGGMSAIITTVAVLIGVLLALQTFVLLPPLDDRVARLIAGEDLPGSWLHTIFAGVEATKVVLLLTLAVAAARA